MSRKIRRQKPMKGGRIPGSFSVTRELQDWVRKESRMYGCSMAFVRANCISFASGIPMESYRTLDAIRRSKTLDFHRRRASR